MCVAGIVRGWSRSQAPQGQLCLQGEQQLEQTGGQAGKRGPKLGSARSPSTKRWARGPPDSHVLVVPVRWGSSLTRAAVAPEETESQSHWSRQGLDQGCWPGPENHTAPLSGALRRPTPLATPRWPCCRLAGRKVRGSLFPESRLICFTLILGFDHFSPRLLLNCFPGETPASAHRARCPLKPEVGASSRASLSSFAAAAQAQPAAECGEGDSSPGPPVHLPGSQEPCGESPWFPSP